MTLACVLSVFLAIAGLSGAAVFEQLTLISSASMRFQYPSTSESSCSNVQLSTDRQTTNRSTCACAQNTLGRSNESEALWWKGTLTGEKEIMAVRLFIRGDSGHVPQPNNPHCQDLDPGCIGWSEIGLCRDRHAYMAANCSKSCGLCTATIETSGCTNNDTNCTWMEQNGECNRNQPFMFSQCQEACNLCSADFKTKFENRRTAKLQQIKVYIGNSSMGIHINDSTDITRAVKDFKLLNSYDGPPTSGDSVIVRGTTDTHVTGDTVVVVKEPNQGVLSLCEVEVYIKNSTNGTMMCLTNSSAEVILPIDSATMGETYQYSSCGWVNKTYDGNTADTDSTSGCNCVSSAVAEAPVETKFYWWRGVLTNRSRIRAIHVWARKEKDNCVDTDAACPGWSKVGLCKNESSTMTTKCPFSCGLCTTQYISNTYCSDTNSTCTWWKEQQECQKNPPLMFKYCREACDMCPNSTNWANYVKSRLSVFKNISAYVGDGPGEIDLSGENMPATLSSFGDAQAMPLDDNPVVFRVSLESPVDGDTIILRRPQTTGALSICEVRVLGEIIEPTTTTAAPTTTTTESTTVTTTETTTETTTSPTTTGTTTAETTTATTTASTSTEPTSTETTTASTSTEPTTTSTSTGTTTASTSTGTTTVESTSGTTTTPSTSTGTSTASTSETTTASPSTGTTSSSSTSDATTTAAATTGPVTASTTPAVAGTPPPPIEENLFNIKLENNSNHVFRTNGTTLVDQALGNDFMTQQDGVTVANHKAVTDATFTLEEGVKPTTAKSIGMNGKNCIKLLKLADEGPIAKTCFQNPSNCRRGISASLWVKLKRSNDLSIDTFYSTGNDNKGLTFKLHFTNLELTIRDTGKQWTARHHFSWSSDMATRWTFLAFTWDRWTGKVNFHINTKKTEYDSEVTTVVTPFTDPTYLYLGCSNPLATSHSEFLFANVLDPAIWFWPVKHNQILMGETVQLLIVEDTITQAPPPTTQPVIEKDYSYSLVSFPDLGNSGENPLYAVADMYYKLRWADILSKKHLESDTLRKRSGVKLMNTYSYGVVAECGDVCPCNFTRCTEGLTLSVWLKIPTVPAQGLILVLQGSVSIGIYQNKFNIRITDKSWLAGTVTAGKTVNLAFTAKGNDATIYVNGKETAKSAGGPEAIVGVLQTNQQSIIVGFLASGNASSAGVGLSDLVIWKRQLFPFERHRFFGYTREQYAMMYKGEMYWTSDPWVLGDMEVMAADDPSYKGNSLYQPLYRENNLFEMDRWSKSKSPVLNNNPKDFFVLGHGTSNPTKNSITQGESCLTNPLKCSLGPGLTVSIWLNIRSVSDSKQRIFLNTGSIKDSDLDSKGFSIYTEKSLLVIRVSEANLWTIRTDSNTYRIGEWMNFGLTWTPSTDKPGFIKLYLNGIDYNIQTISNRPSSSGAYPDSRRRAMVGCFDDDSVFSLKPTGSGSLWETADMVFGDVVYDDTTMSIDKYKIMTGLEDANRFYLLANFRRQGTSLIDLPYVSLKFAKDEKLSIGPSGTIEWRASERVAKMVSGIMILGHFQNKCPAVLDMCENGISAGGWFRTVETLGAEHTFTFFSVGNKADNKDSLGIELVKEKKLQAWVYSKGKNWTVTTSIDITQNKWQHYGLVWSKTDGLKVFINSKPAAPTQTQSSSYTSAAQATDIRAISVGHIYDPTSPIIMDVFNVVIFQESMEEQQLNKLMGVKSSHMKLLKVADVYFTFNGLYYDLKTPKPVISQTMVPARDKSDDVNAAYCTKSDGLSNIDLGPIDHTCLFDAKNCTSYILTMNLKLENGSGVVLSSGGKPGKVGLLILLNSNNTLTFYVRTSAKSYRITSEKITMYEWFQLQFFFEAGEDKGLRVKSNGENKAFSTATVKTNVGSATHNHKKLMFGLHNDGTPEPVTPPGKRAVMCVSDIMASFFTDGQDMDSIANSMLEVSCYQETDLHYALKGNATDHRNLGLASDFSSITAAVDTQQKNKCFSDPSKCSRGLTVSLWVEIDGDTEGYLLTTGPPLDRGVSLYAKKADGSFDIEAVVQDGKKVWVARASGVVTPKQWVNIGLTWASTTSLNLFVSGKPVARDNGGKEKTITQDSSGDIVIGRKSVSDPFLLTGKAVDLVVWYGIKADCKFPHKSKVTLGGICNAQSPTTEEETGNCNLQPNCKTSYGVLCLDPTVDNLLALASQGMKIASTIECDKVLKHVITKVEVTDDESLSAKASVIANIAENWNVPTSFEDHADAVSVLDQLLTSVDDIFALKHKNKWSTLLEQTKSNAISPVNAIEKLMLRIASNLKSSCVPYRPKSTLLMTYLKKIDIGGCPNQAESIPTGWDSESSIVSVPWKGIQKCGQANGGKCGMAVVSYKTAHEFLSSQATYETSIDTKTNQTIELRLNSRVVTLGMSHKLTNLSENERVTFRMYMIEENPKEVSNTGSKKGTKLSLQIRFVYWGNNLVDGSSDGKGQFSSDGCRIDGQDSKVVNASCSHTTSFAVLMQPNPPDVGAIHRLVLTIMTYIGVGLSLVCLIIFFCLIICRKELSGERYIIHLNLCVAMFAAQFCFVLIEVVKNDETSCRAIGICMHLFFTASFTWLFVEALFSFYAVTAGVVEGRIKCYLPFAWGVPIAVVATTAGINIKAYGGKNCWLSPDDYFIWAFLGPILAFIFFTFLLCGIVACNIKTPALKKPKVIDQLKSHSKQTAYIIPLMMLAWISGTLLIHAYSLPIEYIFVIFNTPQGLWVFLCFGLGNPEVKAILCRRKPNSVGDSQQWESVNTRKPGGFTFHSSSPPATFRSTRSLVSSSGSDDTPEHSKRNVPPRGPSAHIEDDRSQLEGPSDGYDGSEYPGGAASFT